MSDEVVNSKNGPPTFGGYCGTDDSHPSCSTEGCECWCHAGSAVCGDCGLTYRLGRNDVPITSYPYTCDDCGGYVDVP